MSRLHRLALTAILTLAVIALMPACAGLQPGGVSPSTAGAPASAGQVAQTLTGQQGQAPSTATGGTSTIVWNFASSVPSETAGSILKIAAEQKWTAEEVSNAIRAAAGAPQTVSISTQTNSSNGGNASSIPAGTGGAAGVGGAGTVQKP